MRTSCGSSAFTFASMPGRVAAGAPVMGAATAATSSVRSAPFGPVSARSVIEYGAVAPAAALPVAASAATAHMARQTSRRA
jgi:hypothetical protein